ncbi:MAG: XTP/dITP diphosphatase [Firmicutes bacterium]|nr:XTP/dITP diphosphatase [Bacillota bacterium]
MKKIVLATGNRDKFIEIKELLTGLPVEILTISNYPGLEMPEEDQPDFAGNAAKKAETVAKFTGEIALADDSGLEVEALGGRPGVLSARYSGKEADYKANNFLLLKELEGVPPEKRGARFVCAIAVSVPGDRTYIIEESCPGIITDYLRGEDGFGYDPLFLYEPAGKTFAEMSSIEKNRVSHRGLALKSVLKLFEELL